MFNWGSTQTFLNTAETLFQQSEKANKLRKDRLEKASKNLIDYIIEKMREKSNSELDNVNYSFDIKKLYQKGNALYDKFTGGYENIPLPTNKELLELTKKLKELLEDPKTHGFTVSYKDHTFIDKDIHINISWESPKKVEIEPDTESHTKSDQNKIQSDHNQNTSENNSKNSNTQNNKSKNNKQNRKKNK